VVGRALQPQGGLQVVGSLGSFAFIFGIFTEVDRMHFLLHEPILAGTVLLCLAIVGGLVLSDWSAKRRDREFMKHRDALREQHRQQSSGAPMLPAAPVRKPVFRIFRWEFAVICVIAVFFLLSKDEKTIPVKAESDSSGALTNNAVVSSPSSDAEIGAPGPEVKSAAMKVAASGKPSNAQGTSSVSVDALFENSNPNLPDSQTELRKNYPVDSRSFAPNDLDSGFPRH
jgi:hypothetical protein